MITPIKYEYNFIFGEGMDMLCYGFESGLQRVDFNGKEGYIDIFGTEYWED